MIAEPSMGRVVSVNVGAVRELEWRGRLYVTGIYKAPVAGAITVRGVNLDGDDQGDRTVHGGVHKAVYAYAREDYEWWHTQHAIDVEPGLFGENLTVEGIDVSGAIVGERWQIGSTLFEVAQPRLPCAKLGMRLRDPMFPKRFQAALRPGAYLRIVQEGEVAAGDRVTVSDRPAHGITLRDMVLALDDPDRTARLHEIPVLPSFWQRLAAG